MKKILIVLAVALIGFISGCATIPMASLEDDGLAKRFATEPDRSVIYLYRNEYFGGAFSLEVTVDGQVAGKTTAYSFFKWDVPPGEHTIKSIAENESSLRLVTKPGKAYFVRQEVKMGMWTARSQLYEVSEQDGKQGIHQCKLIKSGVYEVAHRSQIDAAPNGQAMPAPAEMSSAEKKPGASPVAEKTAITTVPKTTGYDEIPKNVARSGYTLECEPLVSSLALSDFDAAFAHADGIYNKYQKPDGAKQNKYLALLERGKAALAARKYDQCISDLQEAEKRFLTIEGTISLGEGLGSLVTDDTATEYEPEMHEKLMISPYLVLAYLSKGDFDGARVERNRTISKIHQYIEEKPERAYLENPFARLLSAIVYEMEGKYDDAKIEYRKMRYDDEVKRMEEKTGDKADLIILVDAGMAPQKYEIKWGPNTVFAGTNSITLGFTYAGYSPTDAVVSNGSININGKSVGKTGVLYDLEKTILAQYETNKETVTAKLVARMTGKAAAQVAAQYAAEQVAGNIPFASMFMKIAVSEASKQWVAAENADLRSWLTLPKQIHYMRVNDLEPGEQNIVLENDGKSQVQKVKTEKGKILVVYFPTAI
jgi:hypothetical protein